MTLTHGLSNRTVLEVHTVAESMRRKQKNEEWSESIQHSLPLDGCDGKAVVIVANI